MCKSSELSRLLTRKHIEQLALGASFARGETYYANGRVNTLVEYGEILTARVSGTGEYEVRLSADKGGLSHECSCPVGADGDFCKHCVAVALAWLDSPAINREKRGKGESIPAGPLVKLDDVRPWPLAQTPETLAGFLLDAASRDERLREKLLRQAALASAKGIDFAAYRRSIDRACETRGFVHYRDCYGFAAGISEVIEPLNEMIAEGHAAAVIGLAEHALSRVEKALLETDDSDGNLGGILEELQELHLKACRVAKPDPEELAARIFDWELRGEWDVFYGAAERYAGVFGKKGLSIYRGLAEKEWARLPNLKPGENEKYSSLRYRITRMMESLARTDGDLEALVAVKARDLSIAYHFLQIAELYREAKRHDDALAWAERGLGAFPKNTDSRLREFLADEYHRRRRHDDAMALIWLEFDEKPVLANYQKLKQHADHVKAWPAWRKRALARLREQVERTAMEERKNQWHWHQPEGYSDLVRVFLWEKETEAAWRVAQAGGCTGDLWLQLAAAREESHPSDAAPIYQREAEKLIPQKNNQAYEGAVKLLRKVKTLMERMGRGEDWKLAIARLRAEHKPKRNFIALAARL